MQAASGLIESLRKPGRIQEEVKLICRLTIYVNTCMRVLGKSRAPVR